MNQTNNSIRAMMLDRAPERQKALEAINRERINLQCAMTVRDIRKRANLSQKELAKMIGTSQSAIARIENFEYGGRTITMLQRIADALGYAVEIQLREAAMPNIHCDPILDDTSCDHHPISSDGQVDPDDSNDFAFAA